MWLYSYLIYQEPLYWLSDPAIQCHGVGRTVLLMALATAYFATAMQRRDEVLQPLVALEEHTLHALSLQQACIRFSLAVPERVLIDWRNSNLRTVPRHRALRSKH